MKNGGWKSLLLGILSALAVGGIFGTITMGNAQSAAKAERESTDRRVTSNEQAMTNGLDKIDARLEKITDILTEQAIEAAKSHHAHKRER